MSHRSALAVVLPVSLAVLLGSAASAENQMPTLDVHGYVELQLRTYSRNYRQHYWTPSQWANVLNLEIESDLAPEGIGPFELLSAFARVEVRYECMYRGCGIQSFQKWWGDDAERAPRNFTDGQTNAFTGNIQFEEPERILRGNRLGDYGAALAGLRDVIALSPLITNPALFNGQCLNQTAAACTLGSLAGGKFAVKQIDASVGKAVFPMGPWNPDEKVDEVGSLRQIPNPTLPLPLRPAVPATGGPLSPQGLFIPSDAFLRRQGQFDDPEQNFSQTDLEWNHGQSQDEHELKEAYLDIEMFEGRLWMRAGKQSIVWGKTELFRTTDQFNPQDLALSSLPSLEESRISLWSVRGTWSFYDVGPLEDVRLELAVNLDDFEPLDLGQCGEPYTVWLFCGKRFGLWAHGVAGAGVAGEIRPPDPWDGDSGLEGLEFGARVEWRWRRFSFQISDFYGYDDVPVVDSFHGYSRNVDVLTGQPLDVNGNVMTPGMSGEDVLRLHTGNRQLFDLACSLTIGIAGGVFEQLADRCLVDLLNADEPILGNATPAEGLGTVLGGSPFGANIASLLAGGQPVSLVELNHDPNDGPGGGTFAPLGVALGSYLTDQQEALLGCGPFFGTDCDVDGIDLFNAEASTLIQSFPQFEAGGAVATRPYQGLPAVLPGARGPADDINRNGIPDLIDPAVPTILRYSPLVDGCVGPGVPGCEAAHALIDPRNGQPFASEMGALSYNFLQLLAAISAGLTNDDGTPADPNCDPSDPLTCTLVVGVFNIAGSTRPEIHAGGNGEFGRRDFIWLGGAELAFRYEKRNVLGFAFDFAEDRTKTNWSFEATWIKDQPYGVNDRPRGFDENDTFNLTISIDRPTFVNFLNPNRTFFMNSQWFLRYIDDYRQGGYAAHGPLSALGTFTVATGYHQDRLLPSVTWVHDIRSSSGGVIFQTTYRFSTEFSATVGMANFYGDPEPIPVPLRQPLAGNLGGNYESRTRYNGLIPIAERDEVYLLLRYTF
jgi:hypothetical protein